MSPFADCAADIEMVTRAALAAARAHAGQVRKGRDKVPYIVHPLEVAHLVARDGATADAVIAALLHDTVEDSDMSVCEIAVEYGDEVAQLVVALTDAPGWADLSRPERKARQAAHMPQAPAEARRIKIADQLSNLGDIARDPGAWSRDQAESYIASAEEVVDACRGVSPRLEAAFDAVAAEAMQKIGSHA